MSTAIEERRADGRENRALADTKTSQILNAVLQRLQVETDLDFHFDHGFEFGFKFRVNVTLLAAAPHSNCQPIGLHGRVIVPAVHVPHCHKH